MKSSGTCVTQRATASRFGQPVEGRVHLDGRRSASRSARASGSWAAPSDRRARATRRSSSPSSPRGPVSCRVRTLDGMRDILRAAATAAFVVGLAAPDAQPAVALRGGGPRLAPRRRDRPDDRDRGGHRLADRARLDVRARVRAARRAQRGAGASEPQAALEQNEFESLVAEAIDELPEEFRKALETGPRGRLAARRRALTPTVTTTATRSRATTSRSGS